MDDHADVESVKSGPFFYEMHSLSNHNSDQQPEDGISNDEGRAEKTTSRIMFEVSYAFHVVGACRTFTRPGYPTPFLCLARTLRCTKWTYVAWLGKPCNVGPSCVQGFLFIH